MRINSYNLKKVVDMLESVGYSPINTTDHIATILFRILRTMERHMTGSSLEG